MGRNLNEFFQKLNCGNIMAIPFVVLENKKVYPEYIEEANNKAGTLSLAAEYENMFRDSFYINFVDGDIICKRVFENISDKTFNLTELGIEIDGITFGGNKIEDYFYHNENPRIYEVMTFPVDYVRTKDCASNSEYDVQAGNRWADPGVISERIGASPYQPFPAILVSNYKVKKGFVHGTLSQKVFFHNYLVEHKNDAVLLNVLSSFKDIDSMQVDPGRVLIDEWYAGKTDEADNIEKIFSGYTSILRKKLPCGYGKGEVNRTGLVWGTWNDGIFRNITGEMILDEAKFLKKNFPTVTWIQIDDGYAVYDKMAHGLGVPYEKEKGINTQKLSGGLRKLSDKIRSIGFRPAIWIGGFCPKETKIYKDHPEWFLDYDYRISTTAPLDVSLPEVREYMEKALKFFFDQSGFDGIKYDFWSYAFEDSHNLYKNKECSGYEYRHWWLSSIRNYLAKDGYFETCCDIGMGNPFLGEYANNYRYGMDIGVGEWDKIKINYLWGTACFATHTGDMFVPNSDGVGLMSGLNETDQMFYINYCLVTHSMVELAGRLSICKNEAGIKMLQKAVCNPNNGQDIFFANYNYRDKSFSVPSIIYFKTPHFSRVENSSLMPLRTVGLFNIDDEPKRILFSLTDIELSGDGYIITDVWSLEQTKVDKEIEIELSPHESRLLTISKAQGVQLYDSNIRINRAEFEDNKIILETDYAFDNVEFMLSHTPKVVKLCGEEIDFTVCGKIISFCANKKGDIQMIYKRS